MDDTIEIRVPSDPKYLNWIYSISRAILEQLRIDGRRRHFLLVAISEGFTNAHVHGNQRSTSRSIGISYTFDEHFLRVDIEDEGILPIQSNIDELIRPVDPETESGRGLDLIRKLTDDFAIRYESKRGNVLTMKVFFDSGNNTFNRDKTEVADGNHA